MPNGQKQVVAPPILRTRPRTTGYVPLQRLLQVSQPGRLGAELGGRVIGEAAQERERLGEEERKFRESLEKERLGTGAQVAERERIIGTALQRPGEVGEEQQKLFERFRGGEYKGPTELAGSEEARSRAQALERLGGGIGTEAGRRGLLERYAARPGYTSGQKALDVLLLGQAPELAKAREATRGLAGEVGRGTELARGQAGLATRQAQEFGGETGRLLGERISQIRGGVGQRLTEAQKERSEFEALKGALGQKQLTAEQARRLGLSPEGPIYTWGLRPEELIPTVGAPPTEAAVTTREEAARLGALGKLTGRELAIPTEGLETYQRAEIPKDILSRIEAARQRETSNITEAFRPPQEMTNLLDSIDRDLRQAIPYGTDSIQKAVDYVNSRAATWAQLDPGGRQALRYADLAQKLKGGLAGLIEQRRAAGGGITVRG